MEKQLVAAEEVAIKRLLVLVTLLCLPLIVRGKLCVLSMPEPLPFTRFTQQPRSIGRSVPRSADGAAVVGRVIHVEEHGN